jgi:hypothetical protein
MEYKLTSNPNKRALFTVHMKAVSAGESWVRRNPGNMFKVKHINLDGEDYNYLSIYDDRGIGLGWLAYDEDVS